MSLTYSCGCKKDDSSWFLCERHERLHFHLVEIEAMAKEESMSIRRKQTFLQLLKQSLYDNFLNFKFQKNLKEEMKAQIYGHWNDLEDKDYVKRR